VRLATKSIDSDAILQFWFDDAVHQPKSIPKAKQRWYRGGAALDRSIATQFKTIHASVAAQGLRDGLNPHATLARIILLDQFSRHLFRGTPKAFSFDPLAVAFSHQMFDSKAEDALQPVEQLFALHPFHHSEDRAAQQLGISKVESLTEQVSPAWRPLFQDFLKSFQEHALIVERFGRFPHRNEILNRVNTTQEKQYLTQQPQRYGQSHGHH
jgi:uncharacterized protein (DUF924 family)